MNKNNFSLIYFLSRSSILGIMYSTMFKYSNVDSIMCSIIGTIIGLIIIYFFSKIKLNPKTKFFEVILYIIFILTSFFILDNFINSFFLTNTPRLLILLPLIFLAFYASLKDMKTLKYLSFILLIISLIFIITIFLSLINITDYSNLFPLFITKPINIIKSSLIYVAITTTPILLLNGENISTKTYLLGYTFSSIISILISVFIIAVFGRILINLYSFPEYVILKKIKISAFMENVENIFASVWYFDIFYLVTLSIKKIYEIIKNKTILLLIIIIIGLFNTFVLSNNYAYAITYYKIIPFLYLFLTFILIFFSKKRVILYPSRYINNSSI